MWANEQQKGCCLIKFISFLLSFTFVSPNGNDNEGNGVEVVDVSHLLLNASTTKMARLSVNYSANKGHEAANELAKKGEIEWAVWMGGYFEDKTKFAIRIEWNDTPSTSGGRRSGHSQGHKQLVLQTIATKLDGIEVKGTLMQKGFESDCCVQIEAYWITRETKTLFRRCFKIGSDTDEHETIRPILVEFLVPQHRRPELKRALSDQLPLVLPDRIAQIRQTQKLDAAINEDKRECEV